MYAMVPSAAALTGSIGSPFASRCVHLISRPSCICQPSERTQPKVPLGQVRPIVGVK
ncbi:MAG: hypothetical protein Ct9H300mP7_2590 [Verrucomicrobiota bacterium]|nr:MAG: hypothetical protein Ct9H300mP7_2590 [Verrucomicrobiota bacterium]